jgi:hypothetical protein
VHVEQDDVRRAFENYLDRRGYLIRFADDAHVTREFRPQTSAY